MEITEDNIFREAWKGNLEVLKSPLSATAVDGGGRNVLHYLAWSEKTKVNNLILEHPLIDKVLDDTGWAPLHYLAFENRISKTWLEKKYPWFNLGDREITLVIIDEILSYSNAEKFICF